MPAPLRELHDLGRLDQFIQDHEREHERDAEDRGRIYATLASVSARVDKVFNWVIAVGLVMILTFVMALLDFLKH